MAALLLAAGAAYLGYKAARKVRSAYSSAKQEMYEEQDMVNPYYQRTNQYLQPYSGGSNGHYRHSSPNGSGNIHRSGHSYGYR